MNWQLLITKIENIARHCLPTEYLNPFRSPFVIRPDSLGLEVPGYVLVSVPTVTDHPQNNDRDLLTSELAIATHMGSVLLERV